MTMIESIRNYIKTFPGVTGERLNVDFLPEKAQKYSVDVVPVQSVVKWFVDGSSIRQFSFIVASRMFYGKEIRQQLDNLGFFEDFERWITENSRKGTFPTLTGGRVPRRMEVTTSGYVFMPGEDTARYQIQGRIVYYQPAELEEPEPEQTPAEPAALAEVDEQERGE